MVNFSLEGKVALVTGASYGIGFAIATGFAQAGAKIVFNDIKQELVDKGLAPCGQARSRPSLSLSPGGTSRIWPTWGTSPNWTAGPSRLSMC